MPWKTKAYLKHFVTLIREGPRYRKIFATMFSLLVSMYLKHVSLLGVYLRTTKVTVAISGDLELRKTMVQTSYCYCVHLLLYCHLSCVLEVVLYNAVSTVSLQG